MVEILSGSHKTLREELRKNTSFCPQFVDKRLTPPLIHIGGPPHPPLAYPHWPTLSPYPQDVDKKMCFFKPLNKSGKKFPIWVLLVIFFCSSEELTETNVHVQLRVIPSFKFHHLQGFYGANVPGVTQKLAL